MKRIAGTLLLSIVVSACGAAPPRWIEGDQTTWTIPLVDPKAPTLVVEAKIHGKGPYRFLLDPDAVRSIIDDRVARELGLYSAHRYVRLGTQNDTTVPRTWYEVLDLQVGELHATNIPMFNAPAGTLRASGRPIDGIIGSELLSRTMVIHVDRDDGLVHLALTGKQTIPTGAKPINGWLRNGSFYVPARLGDREVTLLVGLGSDVSMLSRDVLGELGAPRFDAMASIVDATGTEARLAGGAVVPAVHLDGISVPDVQFFRRPVELTRIDAPYDGVLGANVMSQFELVVDRDEQILWLAPRA